jgi:hypothetical protein
MVSGLKLGDFGELGSVSVSPVSFPARRSFRRTPAGGPTGTESTGFHASPAGRDVS